MVVQTPITVEKLKEMVDKFVIRGSPNSSTNKGNELERLVKR